MMLNLAKPARLQRLQALKRARMELFAAALLLSTAAAFFVLPRPATPQQSPITPPAQAPGLNTHPLPDHAHVWFAAWSLLPTTGAQLTAIDFQRGPQHSIWRLRYETQSLDWLNDYVAAFNRHGQTQGWSADLRQSRNVQGVFHVTLEVQL